MAQDPNPLSTYFMEQVLEERPTMFERLGPRIGSRFLPVRGYNSYRIVWEKVRQYSPMAGPYAMEELPDEFDELDFETFQSDVLHWGARKTLSPKDIMFLRWAGDVQAVNADTGYGVGPAADDYRRKDSDKIAEYTRKMNEALDNVLEYLQIHSLLGHIKWPPEDADGNAISAASLPYSMGKMKIEHPVPFLTSTSTYGAFHQDATTLTGVTGGVSAHGVAWNVTGQATETNDCNPIKDLAVIADLLEDRMSLPVDNLLLVTSKRVLIHMAASALVRNWILGENRDREFLTTGELRTFVSNNFEWSTELYQSKWEYVKQDELNNNKPTVYQVPYMPYGTVMILPRPDIQEMGVVASAPAPGPAHNWRDGKYMWITRDEKPPFKTDMGMGTFWWPLIFDTDVRFRLNAWD